MSKERGIAEKRPFQPHTFETVVVGKKVVVSEAVFEGLEAVRRSGLTNMLDRPVVADLAARMGFSETTKWIMTHPKEYARAIFSGLEVQNEGETQED